MEKSKKRVAIYVRVSTSDQDSGMQSRELEAWVVSHGHELVGVYADVFTGTSSRRPERDRLLNSLDGTDLVLVWKLDRWGRSLVDVVSTVRALTDRQVEFVSHRDQIDLSTPVGRFCFSILASVAELEVEMMRERIKAGMAHKKAQGARYGAPQIFDYKKIKNLHLSTGLSYRQIAKEVGCSLGTVQKAMKA